MDRKLIDQYEAGAAKLRRAVAGLTDEEARARPVPGQWSTLEVVVHLVDSDQIAIDRMKRMLIEESPPLLYADETAYVAKLHTHDQSLEDALVLFEVGRRQWARVLRKLTDADFERKGIHNRRGEMTVGYMVGSYVKHVDDHLEYVYAKREKLGKPVPAGGPVMERLRAGILIFPAVEVLDFCGPFEVLSVTRLREETRREEPSPFEVFLVAGSLEPVTATGGLRVLPTHDFATCPPLDVVVVPGGWGTRQEVDNEALIAWVRRQSAQARLVTSVCTGSFLLGRAGLLEGRRATTHWWSFGRMRDAFPGVSVVEDEHVVTDGNVITSAGISAGIDMALGVVARLCGEPVARATAKYMEYRYPETNERRIDPR